MTTKPVRTDVIIVGAGPVGLFAVFELGLFDMKCHLVDSLDRAGGQCAALYPDKPIYDIPAWPSVSAQGLVDQLLLQIAPFKPVFSFDRSVSTLEKRSADGFRVTTDEGEIIDGKVVVIAAGGGAFLPRSAPIPGIPAYEGESVFYSVRRTEAFRGHDVLIVGDDDKTLDWATTLQPVARSVTLVSRAVASRMSPDRENQVSAMAAAERLELCVGDVTGLKGEGGRLTAVTVTGPDGETEIPCTRMLPSVGLTTKSVPLADWGFGFDGDAIPVGTETFETSVPGIFAIGDIAAYPGKLRLILSGFHEAALMTQAARRIVRPGPATPFPYTTSSSSLRKKLGVL